MERLLEILQDLNEDIDYETCTELIDAHCLDSLLILSLIAEIEEEYDITIPATEIIPQNFNSAQAMYEMILRLQEED